MIRFFAEASGVPFPGSRYGVAFLGGGVAQEMATWSALGEDYAYLHDYALTEQLGDCRNDLLEFGVTFDHWFSERSLIDAGHVEHALDALVVGEDERVVEHDRRRLAALHEQAAEGETHDDRDLLARSVGKRAERLDLRPAALHAAADAILISDHKGAIEWVNPAFIDLTGYFADEIIAQRRARGLGHHEDLPEILLAPGPHGHVVAAEQGLPLGGFPVNPLRRGHRYENAETRQHHQGRKVPSRHLFP